MEARTGPPKKSAGELLCSCLCKWSAVQVGTAPRVVRSRLAVALSQVQRFFVFKASGYNCSCLSTVMHHGHTCSATLPAMWLEHRLSQRSYNYWCGTGEWSRGIVPCNFQILSWLCQSCPGSLFASLLEATEAWAASPGTVFAWLSGGAGK